MRGHVRAWYGEPCVYTRDCLRNNLLHDILRNQVQRRLGQANTMKLTTFTSTSYLRFVFTPIFDQDIFPWKSLDPSGVVPRSLVCDTWHSNQTRLLRLCSLKTEPRHRLEHWGQQRSSRAQELPYHLRGLPGQTPPKDQGAQHRAVPQL